MATLRGGEFTKKPLPLLCVGSNDLHVYPEKQRQGSSASLHSLVGLWCPATRRRRWVTTVMVKMMTPWHVSGPWQPGGGGGKTNNQPMIILPVNWAESICINSIYHNTVYILHHYRHIIYDMLMMASSRGGKSLSVFTMCGFHAFHAFHGYLGFNCQ